MVYNAFMNRRILLIAAFVIGVLVLGTLLFLVFFRQAPTNGNVNGGENTNAVLPNLNGDVNRPVGNANAVLPNVNSRNTNGATANTNAAPGAIANGGDTTVQTLVSSNAMSTIVDSQGNLRFYDKTTGQFYRLDANGNLVLLTQAKFLGAEGVVWSNAGDQVIITYPDGSKISYNFDTKKQATLPKEGDDFSFSPSGGQIAFKYNAADPNARFLVIANPDGTSISPVEALGENGSKVNVLWSPNDQVVATYTPGLNSNTQEVYFVGKNGENFKSAVTDGRGFEGSWSPDGQRMLYSTYSADSSFNPRLHIVDAQGEEVGGNNRSLELQTWSDKCTFSKDSTTLYCAVPNAGQLPTGSGIYRDQASNVPDTFYQIDLRTGSQTKLASPVGTDGSRSYSAVNVTLSPDGTRLYFTDGPTGRVLSMKLR